MKRTIAILLVCLIIFLSGCNSAVVEMNNKDLIVASFYPVYVFALNLVEGIDEIEVCRMAEHNVGCLHDYTLTAKDAKLLNDATALVINGAGMEAFVEDLYKSVDDLVVVDSSSDIEFICNDSNSHEGDSSHNDSHDHSHAVNSHIWLSVENAKKQVFNIKNGLLKIYPQYENQINFNNRTWGFSYDIGSICHWRRSSFGKTRIHKRCCT